MLCTVNKDGCLIEMNAAWKQCLGYTTDDLRSSLLVSHVHPDDHQRLQAEAARLFAGHGTVESENRFIAKDRSWHWLRWSATLSADESMIYARATDVTELKQVEFEREDLLIEVEMLARSDPLTGLPNRRVLDEQLPREMARARRGGTPLCVAIIDLDRFKAYNDSRGHLAGDAVLRECAITWDSKLRGEDAIVRYGGEEFLVVLPDCTLEHAAEIVRAPAGGNSGRADVFSRRRLLGASRDDGRFSRTRRRCPLPGQARGPRSPRLLNSPPTVRSSESLGCSRVRILHRPQGSEAASRFFDSMTVDRSNLEEDPKRDRLRPRPLSRGPGRTSAASARR